MLAGLNAATNKPIARLPTSRNTELFKNDSRSTELQPIFGPAACWVGAANLTSSSPTMMAGDSIRARAATMKPSKGRFWVSRKLSAVMKVTALIDP